jgi:hypothetical protein
MAARTEEREQFLADIITTAVEGGTGYWAQTSQYQYEYDGELKLYTGKLIEGGGTQATLHELDDDDEGYKAEGLTITTDKIAAAIGKLKRGEIQINSQLAESILTGDKENDAGYIDADGADALTQIALLGELTYG